MGHRLDLCLSCFFPEYQKDSLLILLIRILNHLHNWNLENNYVKQFFFPRKEISRVKYVEACLIKTPRKRSLALRGNPQVVPNVVPLLSQIPFQSTACCRQELRRYQSYIAIPATWRGRKAALFQSRKILNCSLSQGFQEWPPGLPGCPVIHWTFEISGWEHIPTCTLDSACFCYTQAEHPHTAFYPSPQWGALWDTLLLPTSGSKPAFVFHDILMFLKNIGPLYFFGRGEENTQRWCVFSGENSKAPTDSSVWKKRH